MPDNTLAAALHARMQRIEQSQERDRAEVSGVRERLAAGETKIDTQGEDIREIKADVKKLLAKMHGFLALYALLGAAAGTVAQNLPTILQWFAHR